MFRWWQWIAGAHRSDDDTNSARVVEFFLPKPSKRFFLRLGVITLVSVVVFSWILLPCIINGESMVPTFPAYGFTFCWRGRYWFSAPQRGDIVVVRYAGKIYFLKRVVALAGDTVEFRRGTLYVNGRPQIESYVRYPSNWNLPPRRVSPGHLYVVGDNRTQPIEQHRFGQVRADRIIGEPLF